MSHETTAWAKQQRCGCPHVKAVLSELANWARPDGICEFRKVSDIAFVTEISERTVQRALKRLEDPVADGGLGLIRRIERRRKDGGVSANGFELVGYIYPGDTLSPPPVTDSHPPQCQPVTTPVTVGRGRGCQTVTPYKELNLDINNNPPTPRRGKSERTVLPKDWKVPAMAALPPEARAMAEQWPTGAYEAQAEAFVSFRRGRGDKQLDWAAVWAARVVALHPEVIRAAKAGVNMAGAMGATGDAAPTRTVKPSVAKDMEGGPSQALHNALFKIVGEQTYRRWIEPCALLFMGDGLRIVAPTNFHADHIENRLSDRIRQALSELGETPDWVNCDSDQRYAASPKSSQARSGRRGKTR